MTKALKRRKPNQKRAQETRQKLLNAAHKLLNENGFSDLTARRLAKEAGVSVGVIYDYYPSMPALLFWIYEERLKHRLEVFDSCLMGKNLQQPITETLPVYLNTMETEQLWSRIDLELRNAAENDQKFHELISHHEEELTQRYCTLLKAYGSSVPPRNLQLMAQFSNAVDFVNMRLQLNENKDGRSYLGKLTVGVNLMLMEQAGIINHDDIATIQKKLGIEGF